MKKAKDTGATALLNRFVVNAAKKPVAAGKGAGNGKGKSPAALKKAAAATSNILLVPPQSKWV